MPDLAVALAPLCAFAAAIVLLLKVSARLFPAIALVASGLELLRAMAMLNLKVPVIGAAVLFAAGMAVGGVGSFLKTTSRVPVAAATVVAFVGTLRLLERVL